MRKLFILSLLVLVYQTASAQLVTESFGSGANAFSMDFVQIGSPNNAPDTTGAPSPAGSVGYTYNIGKYEISREQIEKANTVGNLGITLHDMSSLGGNGASRPATGVSWNEAARFVNWLNIAKGYQAAYKFTTGGVNDDIALWDAGQYIGTNQYRHKDAFYFLPSTDEWYKAAYGSPQGTWFKYSTGSMNTPIPVNEGIASETIVYGQWSYVGPADTINAGALSPYGTMAQGGNVWEWTESAQDGSNDRIEEMRELRGGAWNSHDVAKSVRTGGLHTTAEISNFGFRISMVPEPSSLSLLVLGGVAVALRRRQKRA